MTRVISFGAEGPRFQQQDRASPGDMLKKVDSSQRSPSSVNQIETPMLGGGRDLDSRNLNSNLQSSGNDSLTKQLLSDDGGSSIKKVSPRKGGNANFYSNIASS